MTSGDPATDDYLLERLQQAFASDPRLNELELEVRSIENSIEVSGTVQTEERKRAVTEIAREIAPGRAIRNAIHVLGHGADEPKAEPETERPIS
jgi:osmotically-inducible protein OsmY